MGVGGHVTFVGAGPGDPAWISVAGLNAIRNAEVLVTDALVSPLLLAEADWNAIVIDVGKRGGLPSTSQDEINAVLLREASAGRRVVRLKGGDIATFGRLAEELAAVRAAGLSYDLIPGITAASGAAARLAMPLTDRDVAASLTLLTGHRRTSGPHPEMDWDAASRSGTVCVYMGVLQAAENAERLLAAGVAADTPVAVVSWATTPRERALTTTLGELAVTLERERIRPPALWLVGQAVAAADLAYAAATRRRGMVALLRPLDRDQSWRTVLEAAGYAVLATPLQRIHPGTVDAAWLGATRAPRPDPWVVVTSPMAAEQWRMAETLAGLDVRRWTGFRIAAVGPATAAALARQGLVVDLVGDSGAAALVQQMLRYTPSTAVWVAAAEAAPAGPEALREAGWEVRRIVSHRKQTRDVPPALRFALAYGFLDAVIWTSPSQVEALCGRVDWGDVRHVAIGATTAAALAQAGLRSTTAAQPAPEAVVAALQQAAE